MIEEDDLRSGASLGAESNPADAAQGVDTPLEEKVGYGRPPVGTRFKPGESGNPRGRPKASKSIGRVLRDALDRRVSDPRRGARPTVSMMELIVEGIVFGAAKRAPAMIRVLLALHARFV